MATPRSDVLRLLGIFPSVQTLQILRVNQGTSLCYAYNANIKHKFDQRAKPGIFIGYPYGHKGYRIYDIESHSIYISRDVIFHEGIFPFRDIPQFSAPPSTVIPLPVHDNENFDFFPHPSPPVMNGHVDTLNNSTPANLDVVDDEPHPITKPASAHAPVPIVRHLSCHLAAVGNLLIWLIIFVLVPLMVPRLSLRTLH
ncbi:hypothetical protein F0562_023842 [Nyssa sinensis]|uniref:Retroviral polymerase SH3-like domain-containing protein n=1 Tax=Nyssa sinensis TaxID=561372 RepID=A0A5J5BIS0_9ASTE|nr:hypothetical protein F0562_023842 [Nyssa sinensis]